MTAQALSAPSRLARSTPILGRVIRDIERDSDTIYYLLTILLTALVLAIQTWGLPALVLTALALIPVMFTLLIILARP
jgi:hypothetical protein